MGAAMFLGHLATQQPDTAEGAGYHPSSGCPARPPPPRPAERDFADTRPVIMKPGSVAASARPQDNRTSREGSVRSGLGNLLLGPHPLTPVAGGLLSTGARADARRGGSRGSTAWAVAPLPPNAMNWRRLPSRAAVHNAPFLSNTIRRAFGDQEAVPVPQAPRTRVWSVPFAAELTTHASRKSGRHRFRPHRTW